MIESHNVNLKDVKLWIAIVSATITATALILLYVFTVNAKAEAALLKAEETEKAFEVLTTMREDIREIRTDISWIKKAVIVTP